MKKSLCIETFFTDVPFYDRFKLAAKSGFENVEFWSWTDKDVHRIKQLCEKLGLKVASFSGDQDYSMIDRKTADQYMEFIKRSIETAGYLSCDNLVIHSNALGEGGKVVNDYSHIRDCVKFAAMFDVLKLLAPMAEKSGVTLVLEALNTVVDHTGNYLSCTRDSAELVKMTGSPNIKILYDVYHMQIMEGNIIENIRNNIDQIGYIHIADVPGRHEPGTGEINFGNLMRVLRSLRYEGVIGFELLPSGDSSEIAGLMMRI